MEQTTDHVLSPMAAELSAMLRMEQQRIDLEPDALERWVGSMNRRSDFDPDTLAVEVVALSLKIRRLAAEAGEPAIAQLDQIARMLMERIDPERGAELKLTIQQALSKTTGAAKVHRAPVHDEAAPAGSFSVRSLGAQLDRPRPRGGRAKRR